MSGSSYRPHTDTWILVRPKVKFYGAYPNGSLHRMRELLGVSIYDPLLHVCSGRVKDYPIRGFGPNDKTVDLDDTLKPDFVMDVCEELPVFDNWGWPAILGDPPYTKEDAEKYAPGADYLPNPNKLMRSMLEHTAPGGRAGLLHYKVPKMPKKPGSSDLVVDPIRFVALITVFMGFGNTPRAYTIFEKQAPV